MTINYEQVDNVIRNIIFTINALKAANNQLESEISRLSNCNGTAENPHNHSSEIASIRKTIDNNEEKIKKLDSIWKGLTSFKDNVILKDSELAESINSPEKFAAYIAGVFSNGQIAINSKSDYDMFMNAKEFVDGMEMKIANNIVVDVNYIMNLNGKTITVVNDGNSSLYTIDLEREHMVAMCEMCEVADVYPLDVLAIIIHESRADHTMVNSKKTKYGYAQGYMQIMSDIFYENLERYSYINDIAKFKSDDYGNMLDPYTNLAAGISLFSYYQKKSGYEYRFKAYACGDGGKDTQQAIMYDYEFNMIVKQLENCEVDKYE